ncbi:hypothetical protein RO03_06720 [Fusobacterium nucleatum subsp. nucleatum]|uniref:Uncharacterized protein n=1 Tax=Fusobacterium nucleatum subsp. nucleatum TaxID=76856 RepID=A0A0X3Y306_FUSNC|nr:DUF4149 domain-containing protein [Fusobacterium nucleatum]ALF24770.1 hypothetical protein RO05_10485 [Fusobacterium nucleatum subsp. nucleatum ChDC F316]ASG25990.1 hypothetical protein RN84_03385 [Fusobacterium nucleatum subsp. nucleatum]KUL99211.1 hypothetical protein RO03_06720 [Fusobacterium nucleatum subsp. nucleatum]
MKEIKVRPLEVDDKAGKMTAYIFFFSPFLALAMATFMILKGKELLQNDIFSLIFIGFAILMVIVNFFTIMPHIANGVFTEEVCYIKNKIFYYTKTRNFLGTKKIIGSFEIPINEIIDVKENEKKLRVNIFSIFKPRNSVEIETRDGKKYSIMNDFYMNGKDSQDNNVKVETREERSKRIFNEVKELIMSAKNENTFNF